MAPLPVAHPFTLHCMARSNHHLGCASWAQLPGYEARSQARLACEFVSRGPLPNVDWQGRLYPTGGLCRPCISLVSCPPPPAAPLRHPGLQEACRAATGDTPLASWLSDLEASVDLKLAVS
jgi:hypothetical protein